MSSDVTQLIVRWQAGEESALEELTPYVYDELKRLARSYMRKESSGHTLQATALVNEAFLKIASARIDYSSQAHFLTTAARLMRCTLVDHARSKHSQKRGGEYARETFIEDAMADRTHAPNILDMDLALDKLASLDPDLAKAIELVFFGGLSYEEAAENLGISRSKFYQDFSFAKSWLRKEIV